MSIVPSHSAIVRQLQYQTDELLRLISNVPFKQCIIFTNYQNRAELLSNTLNSGGWPAIYISGSQTQKERLRALALLKSNKFRILVSTDVTARGIDVKDINLVINYDVPFDSATYLHRVGRAGRYGSCGLCISICQEGALDVFKDTLSVVSSNLSLNVVPKGDLLQSFWKDQFEKWGPKTIVQNGQVAEYAETEENNNDIGNTENTDGKVYIKLLLVNYR